nr:hypothetical protein Iba_chr11dCG11940 [Ipomoea batatas]
MATWLVVEENARSARAEQRTPAAAGADLVEAWWKNRLNRAWSLVLEPGACPLTSLESILQVFLVESAGKIQFSPLPLPHCFTNWLQLSPQPPSQFHLFLPHFPFSLLASSIGKPRPCFIKQKHLFRKELLIAFQAL